MTLATKPCITWAKGDKVRKQQLVRGAKVVYDFLVTEIRLARLLEPITTYEISRRSFSNLAETLSMFVETFVHFSGVASDSLIIPC